MSVLSPDRQARFFLDYPDETDEALAARYGITVVAVRHLAACNGLRKTHHDWAIAARKGHDGHRPAHGIGARPAIPAGAYCTSCGCTAHHWPGCPRLGHDDRPLLPAASDNPQVLHSR